MNDELGGIEGSATNAKNILEGLNATNFVASNMRIVLESIYIGQKILSGTTSQVKSTVQAVLGNLVTSEIVTAFKNVQASINISDPTQIDVAFEISPVFPLNFILITFSLSANQ